MARGVFIHGLKSLWQPSRKRQASKNFTKLSCSTIEKRVDREQGCFDLACLTWGQWTLPVANPGHLPRAADLHRAIIDPPTSCGGLSTAFHPIWAKVDMYFVPRAASQQSMIRLASSCEVEVVAASFKLAICQLAGIPKSSH